MYFYRRLPPPQTLRETHYTPDIAPALVELRSKLASLEWTREAINSALKAVVGTHKLKLPKVAMPLRLMVTGELQTPSIDAVLALLSRDEVMHRIDAELPHLRR
jgi:glutamyl-tRNA synthetase